MVSIIGPTQATFTYDGLGRRQRKMIDGTTTDFIYDRLNPVREATEATTINVLTSLSIDEYLTRATGGVTEYFMVDALGSTLALSDGAGAVATEYSYEPFGTVGVSGASSSSELHYTGRESDGTGLYYYRARYYHPGLQRFVSEDPIEFFGGSANLYQYAGDNPIRDRDPLGTFGPGGAAGAALFNLSWQLGANLVSSGFDLRRSVGCINVADVFISAAVGFVGPSFIPNVLMGKPTILGGQTENVLIYLTTSLPLSISIKLAAPNIRLGGRKDCADLGFGAAVSKIIGP